jgi:hypothetical protein
MSALPPKADTQGHKPHVRFVPKADSCNCSNRYPCRKWRISASSCRELKGFATSISPRARPDQLNTPYFLNQPTILFQASSAASLR